MPLSKAKTRKKRIAANIAIELQAGKPQKQAVATAYSVERQRKKKRKKR